MSTVAKWTASLSLKGRSSILPKRFSFGFGFLQNPIQGADVGGGECFLGVAMSVGGDLESATHPPKQGLKTFRG